MGLPAGGGEGVLLLGGGVMAVLDGVVAVLGTGVVVAPGVAGAEVWATVAGLPLGSPLRWLNAA